jgi:condensin complex subunit 2
LIIGDDKQEARDGHTGDDNNDQDYEDGGDNQPGSDKKRKKKKLVFTDKQGEKTLDKLENINIDHFDTEAMIDPLFKQTTAKFDEMGLGSLMSSKLNVNSDLLI